MVDQREQRLLVGGFSLGLLAGTMGFYFFGTEEGRRIRKKLGKEWNQAQEYFQEQQLFSEQEAESLAEFLTQLKEKIMSELELDPDLFSEKPTHNPKKRRLSPKKSPPKKFVGT